MSEILETPVPARLHRPSGWSEGDPLLLLLHGRGSSEGDLQGVASFLPEGWALLTPRAPFPGQPWGYGPGWAWYRYIAEDRVVPETLEESLGYVDRLLEAVPEIMGGSPDTLVLGGFSQGGTTSLAHLLTRRRGVAGAVNLSGFLARVPRVEEALDPAGEGASGAARGLKIFWGHGERDPNIPFGLGEKGRATLREAGAEVEEVNHSGGHTITPEEMRKLAEWLKTFAEPESSSA